MNAIARIKRVRPEQDADIPLPRPMSAQAAGLDLTAAVTEPMTLLPGEYCVVPTGFAVQLPPGCEGQVRPRSGLAARYGVTLLNSPGTVDSDYRGEVSAILINHGKAPFVIERGMRIAQLVISQIANVALMPVEELGVTVRGADGFGSTGLDDRQMRGLAQDEDDDD